MARKILFEKIDSKTSESLRAINGIDRDRYDGLMIIGPQVGHQFTFYFDRKGGEQYDTEFHTSAVKRMMFDDGYLTVETLNSKYKLTIGEEVEPK